MGIKSIEMLMTPEELDFWGKIVNDAVVVKPKKLKRYHRNSAWSSLVYFDKYMDLGLPNIMFLSEEESAILLYDLTHFPLEQVLARYYSTYSDPLASSN